MLFCRYHFIPGQIFRNEQNPVLLHDNCGPQFDGMGKVFCEVLQFSILGRMSSWKTARHLPKMGNFLLLRELEQLIGLNNPGSSKGRRRIMENENFSL